MLMFMFSGAILSSFFVKLFSTVLSYACVFSGGVITRSSAGTGSSFDESCLVGDFRGDFLVKEL